MGAVVQPDATWQEITPSGSSPPTGFMSAIYDPIGGRMIVALGSEIWALELGAPARWPMPSRLGYQHT